MDRAFDVESDNKVNNYPRVSTGIEDATNNTQIIIEYILDIIKKSNIEELKEINFIKRLEEIAHQEIKVNVVSTMSAGKSTLINALLGQKLMPSKNEACTSVITEIKHCKEKNFTGKVYYTDSSEVRLYERVELETMKQLNNTQNISKVEISCNIPFMSERNSTITLVDTPGPNNSRNSNHRHITYNMIDELSNDIIIYIINATQFGVEDDSKLLEYIIDKVNINDEESQDRIIFAINKLDEFKIDEDNIEQTLKEVKSYLKSKGINKPNIFPISARIALQIRDMSPEDDKYEEYDVYELKGIVRKINKNKEFHFEKYSSLSNIPKARIEYKLDKQQCCDSKYDMALVHSGIISLEQRIIDYVSKCEKDIILYNLINEVQRHIQVNKVKQQIEDRIYKYKIKKIRIEENIKLIQKIIHTEIIDKYMVTKIDVESITNDIVKNAKIKIRSSKFIVAGKRIKLDCISETKEYKEFESNIKVEVCNEFNRIFDKLVDNATYNLWKVYKSRFEDTAEYINSNGCLNSNIISDQNSYIKLIENITNSIKQEEDKLINLNNIEARLLSISSI